MITTLTTPVAAWCAAIVGGLLIAVIWMSLRRRSLFQIALRNIFLSKKKSALVIIGLVLSTILTTASFGLGDSMGASFQGQTLAQTGQRDERLSKITDHYSQDWQYFTPTEAQQLIAQIQANPEVAAVSAAVSMQENGTAGSGNAQGYVPVYDQSVNSVNSENQLLAVPSDFDNVWGSLASEAGQPLRFADLRPGEVYLGNTLAHFLGARAGHRLTLFLKSGPVEVTVRAVLNTEVDPAEKYTLVMSLAYFQQVAKAPGEVNVIYIKNTHQNQPGQNQVLLQQLRTQFGNLQAARQLKDFLHQFPQFSRRVMADVNSNVPAPDPSMVPIRAFISSLDKPQVSSAFVNSVQDKAVQSVLQRVITKIDKSQLTRLYQLETEVSPYRLENFKQDAIFLSQLTGTGISLSLLATSGLLIAAAMLLVYLIFVMLMAERKTEFGISRALGLQRSHLIQMQLFEGTIYTLASAVLGIPLGIGVTALLVMLVDSLPAPPWSGGNPLVVGLHVSVPGLVIAFSLGFLVTFLVVAFSAYRASRFNIVSAIRDQAEPVAPSSALGQLARQGRSAIGKQVRAFQARKNVVLFLSVLGEVLAVAWRFLWALILRGLLILPPGLLMAFLGVRNRDLFVYALGISLCIISLGLFARWLLPRAGLRAYVAEKVGFAILGVGLILYWALPVGSIERLVGLYDRLDMAHFRHGYLLRGSVSSVSLISALLVVVGSIWFVLYYGDWLLKGVLCLIRPFGRFSSALRLSVLYALKNRLRTGLNIAMFALVSFIIVLFITIGTEVTYDSGVTHQTGNWQILTDTAGLPHDFDRQVMADPHLAGMIQRAGAADNEMLTYHIARPGGFTSTTGFMRALDDEFLADPQFHIFPRGDGYTSDSQVWNAVRTQPNLAVMYFDSSVEWGVAPDQATFKPFTIQVIDANGGSHDITVIGFVPAGTGWPLAFVSSQTGQTIYGGALEPNWFTFRVKPGIDPVVVQHALTQTFGPKYGMQAELDSAGTSKLSNFLTSIFNMLAGYLALGLVIGLSGLAVISRRVVIERFQQIGVMRALGCGRGQILSIFLLEASFIAFLGLFIGASLALWWGYQFTMIVFPPIDAHDVVFHVPVVQIGLIVLIFYLIVLVATYLPARAASRIAPAAALRYE